MQRRLLAHVSKGMIVTTLGTLLMTQVMPMPFARGVKEAKAIVVGRVESVKKIGGYRYADVVVERILKGSPPARLRYFADQTWGCDTTDARVGERSIFLLDRSQGYFHSKVPKVVEGRSVWFVSFAGRGRLEITPKGIAAGEPNDKMLNGGYTVPKDFPVRYIPSKKEYEYTYWADERAVERLIGQVAVTRGVSPRVRRPRGAS